MRKKKKAENTLFLAISLLISLSMGPVRAMNDAPETSAVSVILMEQETRDVLFSRDADRQLPIASITKIMTGLLVAERCDLKADVVIRPEWLGTEGSNMGLKAGDIKSVEELLYGLLLASGNDAAVALACYTAGDVSAFVGLMNERASALGMTGTSFRNPHGLTEPEHYSTARDMGILACAAMDNPCFAEICGCQDREVDGVILRNHNRLLRDYPGAIGVKTGYTDAAGRTLVSCAKREEMTLVCVTLNDPADWKDHAALLDWGFSAYVLEHPEQQSWTVPVISGMDAAAVLRPEMVGSFPAPRWAERAWRAELPPFVYAPFKKGTVLGRAVLYSDGEPIYSCPLRSQDSIELDESQRLNLWERLCRTWYSACRSDRFLSSVQQD